MWETDKAKIDNDIEKTKGEVDSHIFIGKVAG